MLFGPKIFNDEMREYQYFAYQEPKFLLQSVGFRIRKCVKSREMFCIGAGNSQKISCSEREIRRLREVERCIYMRYDNLSWDFLNTAYENIQKALDIAETNSLDDIPYFEESKLVLQEAKVLIYRIIEKVKRLVRQARIREELEAMHNEIGDVSEYRKIDNNVSYGYADMSDLKEPSIKGVRDVFKYTPAELLKEFGDVE